jgi:hypothetical protein
MRNLEDVYDTNEGQGEVRLDEQLYLPIVLRFSTIVETAQVVLRKVLGEADVFQRMATSREPHGIHKIDEIALDSLVRNGRTRNGFGFLDTEESKTDNKHSYSLIFLMPQPL